MNTTGDQGAKFFATIRSAGVVRSQDRWFAGVCGGIAARLGLDPLLVRGVLAALTVVGGLGLAVYGLCWLLLPDGRPEAGGRLEAEAVLRGDVSGAAWLAGALVVADLVLPRALVGLFSGGLSGPGWGFLVTALVALLGWWLLHDYPFPKCATRPAGPEVTTPPTQPLSLVKERPAPAPEPPAEPVAGFGSPTERRAAAREQARELAREKARLAAEQAAAKAELAKAHRRPGSPLWTSAVLGLALLSAGAVLAAGLVVDLPGASFVLAACAALAVMGAGAVVAGLRARRTALVGMAWPVAFLAVAGALLPPASDWSWQVDTTWRPTTDDAQSAAVGLLRVDPARLDAGPATATMGAGRLDVLVPADATVLVDVSVLTGTVRWQDDADVVVIGDPQHTQGRPEDGELISGGWNLHRTFAVGPGAAALAEQVQVRGTDVEDWTVPEGTAELHASTWAGEVRVGAADSTTLEQQ
ncbi:PspC domain-containing protein [Kineococcus sp. SYSU DK003]|uniref:PspC domain-containing protein n=1 Tax=Kineococcus sp. SYSU DK003 TaxID=3383124 RepID=UPI003D7DA48C